MSKAIATSMVFVLLVGSSALADLIQDQFTEIGLTNAVSLIHGDQSASSMQNLVVDNAQYNHGLDGDQAREYLFAAVGLSADASGNCGLVDVIQVLGIEAMQGQTVGDGMGAKAQMQTLDMVSAQTLSKADGQGSADALQTIVVNESQTVNNAAGITNSSSHVMGMQSASINGAPGASNLVDSTMTVTTAQSQAAL
ncbi:MAG: hypothetical protein JSW27_00250 [Phycisphaerales bacterium]|nr:MAG: hypothetical protein JSW27_00250 [Phycisphaerales bacterium]